MRRLAVIESFDRPKPPGFDHVFSFAIGNGDSYPANYIDQKKASSIYSEVHAEFLKFLEDRSRGETFFYRGVNLLWCFKKRLLNFVYFVELRYRILQKVRDVIPAKTLGLEDSKNDLSQPNLLFIINQSPWKSRVSIERIPVPQPQEQPIHRFQKTRRDLFSKLAISRWVQGDVKRAEVGVFADPFKALNVIRYLKPTPVVFYSDVLTPRLTLTSFLRNFSIYEADYTKSHSRSAEDQASLFLNRLEESDCLKGFSLSDLSWEELLTASLRGLFVRELPKLIFDIDQMHIFFSKARSLKSTLLDEDVAPWKSAFCQIGRQYGVLSFVECHGSLGKLGTYLPLTTDRIFVWGVAQKQKLVKWGCPADRIIVSGRSVYNEYQKKNATAIRKQVFRDLDLDPAKKMVLVGLYIFRKYRKRIFEQSRRQMIHELFEFMEESQDIQFVIKTKGRVDDNKEVFDLWVKEKHLAHRVKVVQDYDSLKLAIAADAVISHKSTFAIDAFAMKKPAILFRDDSSLQGEEYRDREAFFQANSKTELCDLLEEIFKSSPMIRDRGEVARQECLNEGGMPAEIIITAWLTGKGQKLSQKVLR